MKKVCVFLSIVVISCLLAGIYSFKEKETDKLVSEAIYTGNMKPMFEFYRNTANDEKPQVAYEITEAAFKITIEEVGGRNNREFLSVLFNAVNNPQNKGLKIEAGGRDEYMSPFIALVKYAYVQSELARIKVDTESKIRCCLLDGEDIDVDCLDPHNADHMAGLLKNNVDKEYFNDLLWKNYSLQKVYRPFEQVKLDLHDMYANLKLIKAYYKTATPNLSFDGLKFNSMEADFYSKAPLIMKKGTGTIHITKVFGNGVVVEFVPFFPNIVQDSVTFTASFTSLSSNGIKMGDSINDVMYKMKPYYLKKNSGEWLTYIMPNGQLFYFRFNNGCLDQVTIREVPSWKA